MVFIAISRVSLTEADSVTDYLVSIGWEKKKEKNVTLLHFILLLQLYLEWNRNRADHTVQLLYIQTEMEQSGILQDWPWTQQTNPFVWHSPSSWSTTILSLITKSSAVLTILPGLNPDTRTYYNRNSNSKATPINFIRLTEGKNNLSPDFAVKSKHTKSQVKSGLPL